MINANELRLNNLLQWGDEIAPVNAIWSNGNFELHSEVLQFWTIEKGDEMCTGIPLSEEWLLRFGFIDNCPWEFSFNMLNFAYDDEKRLHMAWGKGPFSVVGRGIQYVHQLQNLYYALTGTELELKK